MAASYPASIKTFTTKTNKVDLVDAAHMNDVQSEVTAIETELGADVAGSVTDLVTRLFVCIGNNGALRQGTSFPGSPVEGQIFYRTDEDRLYVYDGSGWDAVFSSVGIPNNIQVFTASGTWTRPAGVDTVHVKVVGGGAGGGAGGGSSAANATGGSGGGGGAGGYSEGLIAVTGNAAVTIGAGGAAGAGGGTSSFAGSTTIQATGGSAGGSGGNRSGSTPGIGGTGGTGGVGSGGTLNLSGGSGADGATGYTSGAGSVEGRGGLGGSTLYGSFGAKGSGGNGSTSGSGSASAGIDGYVVVYWAA